MRLTAPTVRCFAVLALSAALSAAGCGVRPHGQGATGGVPPASGPPAKPSQMVVVAPGFLEKPLTAINQEFSAVHPEVSVKLDARPVEELLTALASGELAGDEIGRTFFLEAQFRVHVDVTAPGGQLVGHGLGLHEDVGWRGHRIVRWLNEQGRLTTALYRTRSKNSDWRSRFTRRGALQPLAALRGFQTVQSRRR